MLDGQVHESGNDLVGGYVCDDGPPWLDITSMTRADLATTTTAPLLTDA
ncbi:MAG: hypothetical protein AAF268_00960 [Cyanobacteria bacterium P01_A01_bin.3]